MTTTEPEQYARLAQIRARVEAATAGPWFDYDNVPGAHIVRTPDGFNVATVELRNQLPGFQNRDANAALIASAPTDIAYLLTIASRYQGLLAAAKSMQTMTDDGLWCAGCDELLGYCKCSWGALRVALTAIEGARADG